MVLPERHPATPAAGTAVISRGAGGGRLFPRAGTADIGLEVVEAMATLVSSLTLPSPPLARRPVRRNREAAVRMARRDVVAARARA